MRKQHLLYMSAKPNEAMKVHRFRTGLTAPRNNSGRADPKDLDKTLTVSGLFFTGFRLTEG